MTTAERGLADRDPLAGRRSQSGNAALDSSARGAWQDPTNRGAGNGECAESGEPLARPAPVLEAAPPSMRHSHLPGRTRDSAETRRVLDPCSRQDSGWTAW